MRLFEGLSVALDKSKYPELIMAAFQIISIYGTTYLCETFYSTLKFAKFKNRSVLSNHNQKELPRSAVTKFLKLSREVK